MMRVLTIELVPRGTWYKNLRSLCNASQWHKIQRRCFAAAKGRCEVCGASETMHCHEKWEYDDFRLIQRLVGVECLCPRCHSVKHIGNAGLRGKLAEALEHLRSVNGWTPEHTQKYVRRMFDQWAARSQQQWVVNIDWLKTEKEQAG